MKHQVSFRSKTWYFHKWKYHCISTRPCNILSICIIIIMKNIIKSDFYQA